MARRRRFYPTKAIDIDVGVRGALTEVAWLKRHLDNWDRKKPLTEDQLERLEELRQMVRKLPKFQRKT